MREAPTSTARRITVVAHELRGFDPVGGMGTATAYLALALARMGHSVEFLLGMHNPRSIDPYWQSVYASAGIRIRPVPVSADPVTPWEFVHTHAVQLGLREEPPEVVIAHDFGAPAYSALRLRQAGVAFERTLFVIFCHGTRRYIMDLAPSTHVPDLRNLLAVTVQEQAAIELADVVVSPSAYLVEWMRSAGWQLPEQTFVIPYFTESSATGKPAPTRAWNEGERLHRLAFFGRLDERKGITLLAGALNRLEPELLAGVELAFVGRMTATWQRARIEALLTADTRSALRNVIFATELDQKAALTLLSEPGTLAVMPSLQENSPNAVYECLERGIPFIASNVGGVPELVADEDRDRVLFAPTAAAVGEALRRVLARGSLPPRARFANAAAESSQRWADVVQLKPRFRPMPAATAVPDGFALLLGEGDEADERLINVLVHAQRASGADVVTCGIRIVSEDGERVLRVFLGEPGGLGVLTNEYGLVGLFRRELLEASGAEAEWPRLARLSLAGARIVSVPEALVTRRMPAASAGRNADEALRVVQHMELALASPLRATARVAAGLAADSERAGPTRRSFGSRFLRRLRPGGR